METKLIFFDIDGTLLDEKNFTVPPSTRKALQLAQQNGHQCFINTGRPICSIDKIITDIPFDGYICGCGTYIEYQNHEIFHVELPQEKRLKIVEKAFEYGIDAVMEGKTGVYFPITMKHHFIKDIEKHYREQGFPIFTYAAHDDIPFDKFACWYDDNSHIEAFKNLLINDFQIIQRDAHFLEIVPLPYSKATGIQYLTDYLKKSWNDTISVGDSMNDLSMLTFTKESIAMGNSHPHLFDKVTYITTDIQDDGIYHALKHFHLI